jgi:2-dehydro-3-deoxyphosphooctonate aldolase (KDO 8-P synthase)
VQKPGGQGTSSGGNRDMAPYIARAAVAVGVAAVFMETHEDPDAAGKRGISDAPNMLYLNTVPALLGELVEIDRIAKKRVTA